MKAASSYFINHNLGKVLYWQEGYGALSVSKKGLEKVRDYVIYQKNITPKDNCGKKVPLIRLSGQWLERCGFKPGCTYTVNELRGCLLLMIENKEK